MTRETNWSFWLNIDNKEVELGRGGGGVATSDFGKGNPFYLDLITSRPIYRINLIKTIMFAILVH